MTLFRNIMMQNFACSMVVVGLVINRDDVYSYPKNIDVPVYDFGVELEFQ